MSAEFGPGCAVRLRPRRGRPWERVGTAATHAEAVALVGTGGHRGGA